MADKTYANKFLSQAGLAKFWELIKGKFVTSAKYDSTATEGTLTLVKGDGKDVNPSVIIASATTENAGLMSAADKTALDNLSNSIESEITFKGIQVGGTDVEIDSNKKSNIGIDYLTEAGKKYIVLKDLATNGTAISKLDVSEFVIDGLLTDSEVKIENGKATLYLTFSLADGSTKSEIVDLTDLIDIYNGGEGITVTNNTISLNAATDTTLGGIKTGYTAAEGADKTYAVKLDASGKAYVEVPWKMTEVKQGTNEGYVEVAVTGDTTNGYTISAKTTQALADRFTNVEGTAGSAVQTIAGTADQIDVTRAEGSNNVTLSLNKKVTDSLALADTAIQTVQYSNADDSMVAVDVITTDTTVTVSADLTDDAKKAIEDIKVIADGAVAEIAGTADYVTATRGEGDDANKVTIDLDAKVKTSLGRADNAVLSVDSANSDDSMVDLTIGGTDDNVTIAVDLSAATKTRINTIEATAGSAVQTVVAKDDDYDYVVVTRGAGDKANEITVGLSDTANSRIAGAVQSVTEGDGIAVSGTADAVVVGLNDATKASLELADTSVQSINFTANADNVEVKATNTNGDYEIDLMPLTNAEIEAIVNA